MGIVSEIWNGQLIWQSYPSSILLNCPQVSVQNWQLVYIQQHTVLYLVSLLVQHVDLTGDVTRHQATHLRATSSHIRRATSPRPNLSLGYPPPSPPFFHTDGVFVFPVEETSKVRWDKSTRMGCWVVKVHGWSICRPGTSVYSAWNGGTGTELYTGCWACETWWLITNLFELLRHCWV